MAHYCTRGDGEEFAQKSSNFYSSHALSLNVFAFFKQVREKKKFLMKSGDFISRQKNSLKIRSVLLRSFPPLVSKKILSFEMSS